MTNEKVEFHNEISPELQGSVLLGILGSITGIDDKIAILSIITTFLTTGQPCSQYEWLEKKSKVRYGLHLR